MRRFACISTTLAGVLAVTLLAGLQASAAERDPVNRDRGRLKRNPYSRANIEKAQRALGRETITDSLRFKVSTTARSLPEDDRLYTYLSFDPNGMTGPVLEQLEADPTIHIMDFPFANAELYTEEYALDEKRAEGLRDGRLYAVLKSSSPIVQLLASDPALDTRLLDELYLPPDEDETLQIEALRLAGASEELIALRICLLQRPRGFVRYWDNQFGRLEPVRGMQVWGLVFGIPLYTHTDGNGWYRFPYRFSLGTIMGTKAKNDRVTIKPLTTTGSVVQVIPQLVANFIAGSISIRGWVGACAMRNDVNFDYWEHRQNRYWSQLLNAVWLHDQYSQQQGILSAPNNLVVYAHWADANNANGFGSASAPMLHQIASPWLHAGSFLAGLFHFPITSAVLNLLQGLLPDLTFRVNGDFEPQEYESRLAQTAFHELGHGSHFRRAGAGFWLDLIAATMFNGVNDPNDPCFGYGCGGGVDDGNVEVAESWAEFIGTRNALTRYADGRKISRFYGNFPNNWVRFDIALEDEQWFFNNWIPTGIYNDLIDAGGMFIEPWDNFGGATIQQLYAVFNPDVDTMCDYQEELLRLYPAFPRPAVVQIFAGHNVNCPVIVAQHPGMTWTVRENRAGGVVHVGSDAQTDPYNGDTPANTVLPVLCLQVTGALPPANVTPDFYNGWARGNVGVTPPVAGTQLTSPAAADALCATAFGPGWRMAEFHDGHYGPNLSLTGGWSFWGFGFIAPGTRFWTHINDQPANPWN